MPVGLAGLFSARSVVLSIQPAAGSVHHGSNGLFGALGLLHLSWPGSHASDASGSAVSGSAAVAGSPTEGSVATFPTLSTPSRLDGWDESPALSSRSWLAVASVLIRPTL